MKTCPRLSNKMRIEPDRSVMKSISEKMTKPSDMRPSGRDAQGVQKQTAKNM